MKSCFRFLIAFYVVAAAYAFGASNAVSPPKLSVYRAQVLPHWFDNDRRFWYRNDLVGGTKEFILVDAQRGTRERAFDHRKLAAALSVAAGTNISADHLPFASILIDRTNGVLSFAFSGKIWQCSLKSYECAVTGDGSTVAREEPESVQLQKRGARRRGLEARDSQLSPDGEWRANIKDHNLWLFSQANGKQVQLTHDGDDGNEYVQAEWSPDSKAVVVWRREPGDRKPVHLVQSSPENGGRAVLSSRPYDLPGDRLPRFELSVFDVAERKQTKPDIERFEHGWESPRLHWCLDQRHFAYMQVERGHQRLRIVKVNSLTGEVRSVVDERSNTFIWTVHTENLRLNLVNWLEKTDELIYASERDGWRHLYLVDLKEGGITRQITRGEWVVRGIDGIDEDERQIWFTASGKEPDQDPYFLHSYRVGFDGAGVVALTEGNGNHTVQFSPERKFLIDSFSRVDAPPKHNLRRASDGELICALEEADISRLGASGWKPPEVFVAKGRDGKTDIWGIICRPRNFDPAKKYPVIEEIYAGPQGSYVPKSFSSYPRFWSLTELGFIVVQIDGMGTANRSKAFHDVCWKNLKDAGFPDRILWIKAAAANYPYMDLSRVGIYGNSAGGQNAAAAVLFHPEFYRAAVASCGCHDNRMDKASWNEQWMGYPVGPQYAECSNIENAGRLRGKLFLIVGEMDDNVPPESTIRFVDSLVKTGKDFDLLVIPGARHGMGGAYGQRRMQDFFVRHLLGVEPPDRNAGES